MLEAITIADIHAAANRLQGYALQTPLLESDALNALARRRVLVKAECLQRTGSFKFRGGWSAVSAIQPEIRQKGVIAFSSGNHAQGVALAAKLHEVPAVIVMPSDAPSMKIDNTRGFGAEVVLYDRWGEDRAAIGANLAKQRGLTLIQPFDEPMVMAGQGVVGMEIATQAAATSITQAEVLIPCGGGGLTSGVALALEAEAPGMQVRPVEPQGYDDVALSLMTGKRETITGNAPSICDAIVTPSPGELTFPIMKRLCGPGLTVTDEEVRNAQVAAWKYLKVVAEPGGAVALAAAIRGDDLAGDAVICLITGGNADPAAYAETIATDKIVSI